MRRMTRMRRREKRRKRRRRRNKRWRRLRRRLGSKRNNSSTRKVREQKKLKYETKKEEQEEEKEVLALPLPSPHPLQTEEQQLAELASSTVAKASLGGVLRKTPLLSPAATQSSSSLRSSRSALGPKSSSSFCSPIFAPCPPMVLM